MYGQEKRHMQGFGGETLRKETTWKTHVYGGIILRWVFRKWDVGAWPGSIWLRIETGDGHV
jgi:hypothetical protein